MGKSKSQTMDVFSIFFNSILFYIKNFIILSKAVIISLIGIFAGTIWILGSVYFLARNIQGYLPNDSVSRILIYFLALIVITLPGFVIFI